MNHIEAIKEAVTISICLVIGMGGVGLGLGIVVGSLAFVMERSNK